VAGAWCIFGGVLVVFFAGMRKEAAHRRGTTGRPKYRNPNFEDRSNSENRIPKVWIPHLEDSAERPENLDMKMGDMKMRSLTVGFIRLDR
jgi:hypothetical protein